jgi:polyhydroxyalkanoate synthase subunit PhaE
MEENELEFNTSQKIMENWFKASTNFWESMTKAVSPAASSDKPSNPFMDSMENTQKVIQAMVSSAFRPDALGDIIKQFNTMPTMFVQMAQPGFAGIMDLQQQLVSKAATIAEATASMSSGKIEADAFKAIAQIYEREFKQLLNVPQLGLTRAYQERLAYAADRFNAFQSKTAEFFSMLYHPVEQSLKVIQEEWASMVEQGNVPANTKDFYKLWLKTLENNYSSLFRSNEYLTTLSKTLNALCDFMSARQEILQDMLQQLPIPTQKGYG